MSARSTLRRLWSFMTNLKRKLLAAAIACFVSAGSFAQKRDEERRPPKDKNNQVIVQPKQEKPPKENKGDKKDGNKRGKP